MRTGPNPTGSLRIPANPDKTDLFGQQLAKVLFVTRGGGAGCRGLVV
jgi:hypothetical protein